MTNIIQSVGGFVYYLDDNNEPKFLIIKRHALSGKIERVAPKGKVQEWETEQEAALREVGEETGLPINQIIIREKVGTIELRFSNDIREDFNKDITYYLMEYSGDPELVHIQEQEWYLWTHKWATFQEISTLVNHKSIRELIRKWYVLVRDNQKRQDIKNDFMNLID